MSTAGKRRGTAWENAVRDYMRPMWPDVERAPRWGKNDKGDLVNTGPFCVECKATKSLDLATAVKEAELEAINADKPVPVVFFKRRNKSVADAYVVMPAWALRKLLGLHNLKVLLAPAAD